MSPQPAVLYGVIRNATADDHVSFSLNLDINHEKWIDIPAALIESIAVLDTELAHQRVRLQLKLLQTQEGQLFRAIADVQEEALKLLQRRILPALAPDDDPERANPACLACLKRCQEATYAPDDILGPTICMLNCSACPG